MRFILSICCFLFLSCKNNGDNTGSSTSNPINNGEQTATDNSDKEISPGAMSVDGCYMRILQRDTMVLHVQQDGNRISGKMSFDNYEKDGSTGTVTGTMEKDILRLWYSFQSEGMNSVMELYFKLDDASVIQGVGPMANKADTAFFTDHSRITYSSNQSLKKVDCANVPEKYL